MNVSSCLKYLLVTVFCLGSAMARSASDDELADKIIKQLEASGALDSAVDRAIDRRIQRDTEQKQKAAEEERTRQNELTKNARKVDPARDHLWGDKNARISVILYSDMECPFCKRFAGVPESAAAKFGGKVNVVWRHFPLQFHNPSALKEAHASECVAKQAGSNGFFSFANAVLKASNGNGQGLPDGDAGMLVLAKQAGVKDMSAFKTCLQAPQTAQAVEEDMKDGAAAGITGTPGVILRDNISGHSGIIGGAIPQADVEAQITGLLSESQSN